MSKIKNGGLDQYGAEPFEQKQFGTAGVEGVKHHSQSPVTPQSFTGNPVSAVFHVCFHCRHMSLENVLQKDFSQESVQHA